VHYTALSPRLRYFVSDISRLHAGIRSRAVKHSRGPRRSPALWCSHEAPYTTNVQDVESVLNCLGVLPVRCLVVRPEGPKAFCRGRKPSLFYTSFKLGNRSHNAGLVGHRLWRQAPEGPTFLAPGAAKQARGLPWRSFTSPGGAAIAQPTPRPPRRGYATGGRVPRACFAAPWAKNARPAGASRAHGA